ncbi:hypothetical protein AeMF1_011232 [Aphanomyces euteiches]|nr:hypothetical protein AeMF1_011232 [Aphanomyces euteiches]
MVKRAVTMELAPSVKLVASRQTSSLSVEKSADDQIAKLHEVIDALHRRIATLENSVDLVQSDVREIRTSQGSHELFEEALAAFHGVLSGNRSAESIRQPDSQYYPAPNYHVNPKPIVEPPPQQPGKRRGRKPGRQKNIVSRRIVDAVVSPAKEEPLLADESTHHESSIETTKKRRGPKPGWKVRMMQGEEVEEPLTPRDDKRKEAPVLEEPIAPAKKKRGRPPKRAKIVPTTPESAPALASRPRGRPKKDSVMGVVRSPLTTAWDELNH